MSLERHRCQEYPTYTQPGLDPPPFPIAKSFGGSSVLEGKRGKPELGKPSTRPAFSEPRKRTPDLETRLSFLICEYIYLFKCVCLKIWRRQWHPTPVLLPGKSHGWRSLVGCSLWGRKESYNLRTLSL